MLDIMTLDLKIGDDLDMKLDSLEFGRMNLMAGQNGSGKTLLLKFGWFLGYTLQLYKAVMMISPANVDATFAGSIQKVFEWTFDETEDITGTVGAHDKNKEKFNFSVTFKEGKLDYFVMDILDPKEFTLNSIEGVQFNSKTARTFDNYAQYLKFKKSHGIANLMPNDLEILCEHYKLYDVMWFEKVLTKVKNMIDNGLSPGDIDEAEHGVIYTIFENTKKDAPDCYLVSVREEHGKEGLPIFVLSDGREKKALRLSSGHQSLLMMGLMI